MEHGYDINKPGLERDFPAVVLCGFMGCGKTTVGKVLSGLLNADFIDTDKYIIEKTGMPVTEIFDKYGEDYFRDLEHETCKTLAVKKGVIIAAGGGALTFKRNITAFKGKNCTIVFLDVPVDIISKRLMRDTARPLLQVKDKEKVIHELYEKRIPLYQNACDFSVDASKKPEDVAKQIIFKAGI